MAIDGIEETAKAFESWVEECQFSAEEDALARLYPLYPLEVAAFHAGALWAERRAMDAKQETI